MRASLVSAPAPLCPVLEACGGCPLLELTAEAQARHKLEALSLELSRVGIKAVEPEWVASGSGLGYRNRIRLRIDDQGRVVFFNQHKSPSCAVLRPELAQALGQLLQAGPVRALRGAGHVELRLGDIAARIGLCVYGALDPARALDEVGARLPTDWRLGVAGYSRPMPCLEYVLRVPQDSAQAGSAQTSSAPASTALASTALSYAVPLTSFVQVNSAVNRALVERLVAEAEGAQVSGFIDLFSGAGNFSLALLDAGLVGVSVEQNAEALGALERGAQASRASSQPATHRQQIRHSVLVGDARAPSIQGQLQPAQLLLANPPRAGLFPSISAGSASPAAFARLATRHIALCSCNPVSLSRDLRALGEVGFEINRMVAFDMFPGTRHLETLAWLSRI